MLNPYLYVFFKVMKNGRFSFRTISLKDRYVFDISKRRELFGLVSHTTPSIPLWRETNECERDNAYCRSYNRVKIKIIRQQLVTSKI